MTVGEYLSVFASFILALAVAELVLGLHRLLRHREHIEWDWMTPAMALLVMFNIITFWWATYRWYGSGSNPSILGFLPDVATFVVLFLMSAAVFPDDVPEQGLSLREFYRSQARYIWSLQVLILILVVVFVAPRKFDGWQAVVVDQSHNIIAAFVLSFVAWTKRMWIHQIAIVALIGMAFTGWLNIKLDERNKDDQATPKQTAPTSQSAR